MAQLTSLQPSNLGITPIVIEDIRMELGSDDQGSEGDTMHIVGGEVKVGMEDNKPINVNDNGQETLVGGHWGPLDDVGQVVVDGNVRHCLAVEDAELARVKSLTFFIRKLRRPWSRHRSRQRTLQEARMLMLVDAIVDLNYFTQKLKNHFHRTGYRELCQIHGHYTNDSGAGGAILIAVVMCVNSEVKILEHTTLTKATPASET